MGPYLAKPMTRKNTNDGFMNLNGHKKLPFSVSSMQGWRKTMEDAYIATSNLERSYDVPDDTSLYAVFDGHRGKEVALFCAKYYVELLLGLDSFKAKRYKEALVESFHELDKMILDPKYAEELRIISDKGTAPFSRFSLQRINGDIEEDNEYDEEKQQSLGSLVDDWDANPYTAVDSDKDIYCDEEKSVQLLINCSKSSCKEESDKVDGKHNDENSKQSTTVEAQNCSVFEELLGKESVKSIEVKLPEDVKAIKSTEQVSKNKNVDELGLLDQKDNESDQKHKTQARYADNYNNYLPTNAGTTACVVLIIEGRIYVANAGDSRAVLCRDKKAYPLSFDHKPSDTRERNRIVEASKDIYLWRNLLFSRCIGNLKYKQNKSLKPAEQIVSAEPDIEITEVSEKDLFLVVASDGVWDVMTNDEMVNFISKSVVTSAKHKVDTSFLIHNATEELFDHCITTDPNLYPMGSDNMTAIIVCLRPLEEVVSAFWL